MFFYWFVTCCVLMDIRKKINQYGILLVGLMIGGGFALGGIVSYSGLVDTGSSQREEFDAQLPSQNYIEGSFDLDRQEQLILAAQNDAVFISVFYEDQEQLENMRFLESVPQEFNNRVFIQVQNSSSDSPLLIDFGVTEFPKAIVIGSSRSARVATLDEVSKDQTENAVCQVIREWGQFAAKCT